MTKESPASGVGRLTVGGIDCEVVRRGSGAPILFLHGMQNLDPRAPFLDLLAKRADVIAPSHPGFGGTPRPEGFEKIHDLVLHTLDVIDALGHDKITLMGLSFGGWIAAEIATLRPRALERLILVDAFGIKISDRETPDILDVFNAHPDLVRRQTWHDPRKFAPDYDAMSDDQLLRIARNWDALCLFGWSPYMHNPQLKRWLGRIDVPTLVLWGASDGIVKPAYGQAYSAFIPRARFATIDRAGHHPEIEQPEAFADHVLAFLDTKR